MIKFVWNTCILFASIAGILFFIPFLLIILGAFSWCFYLDGYWIMLMDAIPSWTVRVWLGFILLGIMSAIALEPIEEEMRG